MNVFVHGFTSGYHPRYTKAKIKIRQFHLKPHLKC